MSKVIDLSAVEQEPIAVKMPLTGREVPVRPVDAYGFAKLRKIAALEARLVKENDEAVAEEYVAELFALAQRCTPTATPEEHEALAVVHAGLIIKLAGGRVREVEALLEAENPPVGSGAVPPVTP